MPAPIDTLFLQDSEVLGIEPFEAVPGGLPGVRIRLSAASVRRQAGEGPGSWGFLKPLWIELDGARVQGRLADCVGRIGEGTVHVGGEGSPALLRAVPLPWCEDRGVVLSLSFRMGGEVRIDAGAARCEPGADARFFESLAC